MQRESTGVRSKIVWESKLNPQQTVSGDDCWCGNSVKKRSQQKCFDAHRINSQRKKKSDNWQSNCEEVIIIYRIFFMNIVEMEIQSVLWSWPRGLISKCHSLEMASFLSQGHWLFYNAIGCACVINVPFVLFMITSVVVVKRCRCIARITATPNFVCWSYW